MNPTLNALIIDDSEDDAVLIAQTLKRGGYNITYQRVDTSQAIRQALDHQLWDLMIADYAMPQFSELAAISQLRKTDRDIPLILVSGTLGEETVIAALRAGADDFVMKDHLMRLVPTVQRALKETQLRRAQQIVQGQLRILSRAVEQSPVSVMIMNTAGEVDYVNPRFTLMTGYAPDEVLGRPISSLWSQSSKTTHHELWETITTAVTWSGEFQYQHRSRELCWATVSISPIYGPNNSVTHYVAIAEDISERKQREKEQARHNERLQHHHATLIKLATHPLISEGYVLEGLDLISKAAKQTLQVDYVNIRHSDIQQPVPRDALPIELPCKTPFSNIPDDLANGEYHKRLTEDRIVIVEDARHDPRITDAIVDHWENPGIVAALDVAINVHGRIVGVVSFLQNSTPRSWHTDDITFAIQIADLVAQLCLNANLRRRADEMATITRIGREITSARDLDQVFSSIAHHAVRLAGVKASGVYAYRAGQLYLAAQCGVSEDFTRTINSGKFTGDLPIGHRVFREKTVVQIPDVRQRPPHPLTNIYVQEGIYALLGVPIIRDDTVIGSIVLGYHEPHRFVPQTIAFIQALAQQCVHAEENARLFEAEAERRREAETLFAITQVLSASLDLPTVFELILSELQEVVPYDSASVQQLQGDQLVIIGGRGFPNLDELRHLSFNIRSDDNPNSIVVNTRSPLTLNNVRRVYRRFSEQPHDQANIHSWLGVPLIFGDRIIGMISLDKQEPDFYTDDYARLAQAFAAQAAIAIENARLFAEEERRAEEYANALQQQQRLDELKDQFIQNVSHELRTPLAIARGYAELLEAGELGELAPEQEGPVSTIARRLRMLSRLIDDISVILEIDTSEPNLGLVNLSQLVETTTEEFRPSAAAAGRHLTTAIRPDLPKIQGDRIHLRRMIDNLLSNALKFTDEDDRISVTLERDTTHLQLSVSDTGIGIPEDQLEHIFERFYQVDGSMSRRYGGTGLGLALVKQIAEHHKGTISVKSQTGVGSTFTIEIPIVPASTSAEDGSNTIATEPDSIQPSSVATVLGGTN